MKKIFAGNWKMNHGPQQALQYFEYFQKTGKTNSFQNQCLIFAPAYCLTKEILSAARSANFEVGAQNVHWEGKGAYTAELSAEVLYELGVRWTLIGHSERRQFFGETDQTCVKRFERAARSQLNVVYCIGETLEQRESGQTNSVLEKQLQHLINALRLSMADFPHLIFAIAYEPVWAIGTGKTASTDQAEEAHSHIRRIILNALGEEAAKKIPLLYGGSVTAQNAQALLQQPNINGVLVGGASLTADGFEKILVQDS